MTTRALVTTYSFDASSDSRSVTIPTTTEVLEISISTMASGVDQTSVTAGGVNLSKLGTGVHSGGKPRISVWFLIGPPTGAQTVVITHAGGASDKTGVAVNNWETISDVNPFTNFISATGTSTTPSVNVSSAVGDLVGDAVGHLSTTALTQGGGQTELWDFMPIDGRFGGSNEAGASSVTMDWTSGESKEWTIVGWNGSEVVSGAVKLEPMRVYRNW